MDYDLPASASVSTAACCAYCYRPLSDGCMTAVCGHGFHPSCADTLMVGRRLAINRGGGKLTHSHILMSRLWELVYARVANPSR